MKTILYLVDRQFISCGGYKHMSNENARVSHLPRVDGVQNSPNNFDLNHVTFDLGDLDLNPCDLDLGPSSEN